MDKAQQPLAPASIPAGRSETVARSTAGLFTSFGVLLVLLAYTWFVSLGTWTHWPLLTDYYDQLAGAFAHGSLALEQQVAPEVLALAHPYSPAGRGDVSVPLDFSLYNGKYYLYFGPVPALPLALLKLVGAGQIGDQFLVFAFIAGIALLQALFLVRLRRFFFPDIPDWLLTVSILFSGLISPFTWMLTEARIYEAAGVAGQFFLLAGCYFILVALTADSHQLVSLFFAGLAWALSIGSRLSQAVPIGLLVLLIAMALLVTGIRAGSWSKALRQLIALGLPLAVGFALLGWYNWARFGSVFETGFTYELTTTNFQKHDEIFSAVYVLPNAYNYLITPPQLDARFPFLDPVRGRGELHFPFLDLPRIYHSRAMTGILASVPFVVFAILAILPLLPSRKRSVVAAQPPFAERTFKWVTVGLWIAFLAGLAVILSYFYVVTRFVIDFTPSLILLSIMGFWLGYEALRSRPGLRRAYLVLGLALMLSSVVISNLLVFSMHSAAFQANNPPLWNLLFGSPSP